MTVFVEGLIIGGVLGVILGANIGILIPALCKTAGENRRRNGNGKARTDGILYEAGDAQATETGTRFDGERK